VLGALEKAAMACKTKYRNTPVDGVNILLKEISK